MKRVPLIEAQAAYETLAKQNTKFKPFKTSRCPKNCRGRSMNGGNCTLENCIKLDRNKKALKAVEIALGNKKRPIRKFDRADVKTLMQISGSFKYRRKDRPEIKRQLESSGGKMPRLSNPNKRRLRLVNETRAKMGLREISEIEYMLHGGRL